MPVNWNNYPKNWKEIAFRVHKMKQQRDLFAPYGTGYRCLYMDPPWQREAGGGKIQRGANRHYSLMSQGDLFSLKHDVWPLIDTNGCYLFLWVTTSTTFDAVDLVRELGAHFCSKVIWKKPSIGLGQYVRQEIEEFWICRWGSPGFIYSFDELATDHPEYLLRRSDGRHQIKGQIEAPKTEHSKKPEEFRKVCEWMSHGPRLEMFARRQSQGWDLWGNEVESDVEIKSRKKK